MFGIKKKIIDGFIDQALDFVEEKLNEFKTKIGDNDQDGQNDVDQLIDKVKGWGSLAKELMDGVKLKAIFTGIDQISAGVKTIAAAIDKEKFTKAANVLKEDLAWLGSTFKAGFEKLKEKESNG